MTENECVGRVGCVYVIQCDSFGERQRERDKVCVTERGGREIVEM